MQGKIQRGGVISTTPLLSTKGVTWWVREINFSRGVGGKEKWGDKTKIGKLIWDV